MNRKDFLVVLLVAGWGGILGGGIINFLLNTPLVKAESELLPWQKKSLEREEERQTQRSQHINSLDLIQAEGFILRDKEGKVRAILSTEPNGVPFLEMLDEKGRDTARLDDDFLSINGLDRGAMMAISPERLQISKGSSLLQLQVGKRDSEDEKASISLTNFKQNKFITFSNEGPAIEIQQGKGLKRDRFILSLDERDSSGQPSLEMKFAKFGGSSFLLRHLQSNAEAKETMALGILDKDGEVIWSAP